MASVVSAEGGQSRVEGRIGRTKVFGEEDHAEGVDAERDNFRNDHVNVPEESEILVTMGEGAKRNGAYQIVISNATMMSSFRIKAVNEMATMFKNSFSNRTRAMIMIAAPGIERKGGLNSAIFYFAMRSEDTLVDADHEPDKESLVR
jgi:hypothetical protein